MNTVSIMRADIESASTALEIALKAKANLSSAFPNVFFITLKRFFGA
jgi:hypothetical protein